MIDRTGALMSSVPVAPYGAWLVSWESASAGDSSVMVTCRHRSLGVLTISVDVLAALCSLSSVPRGSQPMRLPRRKRNGSRLVGAVLSGIARMPDHAVLRVLPPRFSDADQDQHAFWNVFKAALVEARRVRA